MTAPKLVEDNASIVLIGPFNPAIFQPAWLAAKGLIRESEATAATIEILHREIAAFRADWLALNVTRERFVAITEDAAQYVQLRDLVVGILGLLEHTPTTRLGLNRAMVFDLESEEWWHALGDLVMPKPPWEDLTSRAGLLALAAELARGDGLTGRQVVKVEPWPKRAHSVRIEINNDLSAPENGDNTSYFARVIRDEWERVLREALSSAQQLIQKAKTAP